MALLRGIFNPGICGAPVKLGPPGQSTCMKCGVIPDEEIRVNLIIYEPGSISYTDGL